ncbi:MAG TPA: RNA methyltransferase [Bacteroidia bacterium]
MISKATIQYVRSLQDKKQRQKYGHFVVEGEKSITELLKSNFEIQTVYTLNECFNHFSKSRKGQEIVEVTDKELTQISAHKAPQKALAVVKIPAVPKIDRQAKFILALDEIQDPGNLGTIIRIADWYGISQIVCSKGCTDVYNPKCINSTMGSFLRVEVIYDDIISVAETTNLPLMVAVFDGKNVHESGLPQKGILVIGNEGHGVNSKIIDKAMVKLTIPKFGGAESLNAAVSTAILLDNLMR